MAGDLVGDNRPLKIEPKQVLAKVAHAEDEDLCVSSVVVGILELLAPVSNCAIWPDCRDGNSYRIPSNKYFHVAELEVFTSTAIHGNVRRR